MRYAGQLAAAIGCALVISCTAPVATSPAPSPVVTASPAPPLRMAAPTATPAPTPAPTPRPDPPVVAEDPAGIAAQMATAERAIRDRSVSGLDLAWMGHLQQLTYRKVAAQPSQRALVLAALPAEVRAAATANMDATSDLRSLVNPGSTLPAAWLIVEPAPMEELLGYYRSAEAEFGVPWYYLASIHLVETRMGRIRGTSTAGAQGPMQFMPATWAAYGRGDVNSNKDAIAGAARYLKANGAPANMPSALFRYNNSDRYVRAVTAYAENMRTDEGAFRGYYHWQVYYLMTRGDILLPVGYGR